MMHNNNEMMSWGGMWLGSFTMLAVLAIVILGIVALVKYIKG